MSNNQGKLTNYINYRMKAHLIDGRHLIGQMLAFDKHMNMVLAECEEYRPLKASKNTAPGTGPEEGSDMGEKRALGLVIVRGKQIVYVLVESLPPADQSSRLGVPGGALGAIPVAAAAGPGVSRPAGRNLPVGLTGPAPLGGPPGAFPSGPPGFAPPGFQPRGGPPGSAGFPPPAFPGAPPGFVPGGFPPGGHGRNFPPPPPGR